MKYTVSIERTITEHFEVEAESLEEADSIDEELANTSYEDYATDAMDEGPADVVGVERVGE
jgi:hypothetical protein